MLKPIINVSSDGLKEYMECGSCGNKAKAMISIGSEEERKESVHSMKMCEGCMSELCKQIGPYVENTLVGRIKELEEELQDIGYEMKEMGERMYME